MRKRHGRNPADDVQLPVRNLPLAVLWVDPKTSTILSGSPALKRLAGYRGSDLRERPLACLFPDQVPENTGIIRLVKRRALSAAEGIHAVLVTRTGRHRFVRISVDCPRQKRGSRRLVRLVVVDEGVIREELERLKRTNARLDLMGNILRHDFANSLFSLRSRHMLLEKSLKNNPSHLSSLFSRMADDMDAMGRLMDFSRECRRTGSDNAVWRNVGDCITATRTGTCHLETDIDGLEILGDGMIQEVFYTLFENAMRHGKTGTGIRVHYRYDGDSCTIITEDNGIGIPEEKKELIFARGYGEHTGFGLYFARLILELNGMTIRETGTCGSGARFEIQVPRGAFRVILPADRDAGDRSATSAPDGGAADR